MDIFVKNQKNNKDDDLDVVIGDRLSRKREARRANRLKTELNRNQENIQPRKIRKSPYFLYLINNKDRLIKDLIKKSIEYEKIKKKDQHGYCYVDSDIPIPGDSLTDRIQKLLYYELKANVDLMAFQSLTRNDEINIIDYGRAVKIQVDFGNGKTETVILDEEKYRKVAKLDEKIEYISSMLIDEEIDTNNKIIEIIEKERVARGNKPFNDFVHNIKDLAKNEQFQSDERRFLDLERTNYEHNKKYKIKHEEGFIPVAEGYKFGGLSKPIPVIKRILSPGNSFNKHTNTWIQKKDKKSPTTEIYKAKVLELLGVSKNKIRLQSRNWNVEYIKMNENAHILDDVIDDKNYSINKKDLVKNVLISYMFFIGDRHGGNLMDDMSHIDFGIDLKTEFVKKSGDFFLTDKLELSKNNDFAKYIEKNDFSTIHSILYSYMAGAWYGRDVQKQFANIPQNKFEKYCREALNEISNNFKKPGVLEELHKINADYKKDMKKTGDIAPSNLFFVTAIEELSKSREM